jgi:DNA-binding response OmpR family regulator
MHNANTVDLSANVNPAKMPGRETVSPFSKRGAPKAKILVVDDDPQVRQGLDKMLRAEGYQVVLAADGREAIAKFNAEPMDLLLLDVGLPDMSGWQVFGRFAAINPFVPIIIITGKDDQSDLVVLSGVGALFEKPINISLLLPILTELLTESPETRLQRLLTFAKAHTHWAERHSLHHLTRASP